MAHIGEVDERRLYAREASSMFAYCTQVLHLSEGEAYLRITVARASRKHPMLLEMLSDGRLHLTAIGLLAPHLTEENRDTLLARACHKSKRQIEEFLAELSPKPDVPASMRKLPMVPAKTQRPMPQSQLRPDGVTFLHTPVPAPSMPRIERPVLKPLSPARYKVEFTASSELRDKLERLQAFLHVDLAGVIEVAVTEKLERLESKRYAETRRPRKILGQTDTSPKSRYIPAPVRRAVRKRDGNQCRFVNEEGRRCTEQRGLEFHHDDPFGRGGAHDPDRMSLMCRAHNIYLAERDYGKEKMKKYRGKVGRVSEPTPIYYA
ncbi:MAG: HNH endonuclease, partial [Vicinamibacteria bacterium]